MILGICPFWFPHISEMVQGTLNNISYRIFYEEFKGKNLKQIILTIYLENGNKAMVHQICWHT